MRHFAKIFLAVLLFCGGGILHAQEQMIPISLPQWLEVKSSSLSKDSILVGEQVVWSTVMAMPQQQEIAFLPYAAVVEAEQAPVDVVRDFRLDTLSIKNGIKELEARLLLTSFDSGYYKLPLMVALTPQGDTIYLDSPFLDVTNIQIDTANFTMHPIKGQMRYPLTFKEVLPWILLGLFVIAAAYLLYRYIKYRRENRDFFGKPVVKDPPHIIALRALDKLRSEKLWQNGKEKLFYTGITDTLREYIEARYNVSAMEKTSGEIMESLKDKSIEEKQYGELDELFKTADLVKFAKYIPQVHENEEAIPVAVRFVNSTFEQTLEEDKQKEEK
ncbi:MAG: hypothetical protein J6A27_06805 [Bacteroidales bacterium]|nr:hypothetical protein [Bacteroidales bacterium]